MSISLFDQEYYIAHKAEIDTIASTVEELSFRSDTAPGDVIWRGIPQNSFALPLEQEVVLDSPVTPGMLYDLSLYPEKEALAAEAAQSINDAKFSRAFISFVTIAGLSRMCEVFEAGIAEQNESGKGEHCKLRLTAGYFQEYAPPANNYGIALLSFAELTNDESERVGSQSVITHETDGIFKEYRIFHVLGRAAISMTLKQERDPLLERAELAGLKPEIQQILFGAALGSERANSEIEKLRMNHKGSSVELELELLLYEVHERVSAISDSERLMLAHGGYAPSAEDLQFLIFALQDLS